MNTPSVKFYMRHKNLMNLTRPKHINGGVLVIPLWINTDIISHYMYSCNSEKVEFPSQNTERFKDH